MIGPPVAGPRRRRGLHHRETDEAPRSPLPTPRFFLSPPSPSPFSLPSLSPSMMVSHVSESAVEKPRKRRRRLEMKRGEMK